MSGEICPVPDVHFQANQQNICDFSGFARFDELVVGAGRNSAGGGHHMRGSATQPDWADLVGSSETTLFS